MVACYGVRVRDDICEEWSESKITLKHCKLILMSPTDETLDISATVLAYIRHFATVLAVHILCVEKYMHYLDASKKEVNTS